MTDREPVGGARDGQVRLAHVCLTIITIENKWISLTRDRRKWNHKEAYMYLAEGYSKLLYKDTYDDNMFHYHF